MIKQEKATTNARVAKNKARVTNSEEVLAGIFDRLSDGESINTICSTPDMPSRSSFFKWLKDDKGLLTRYNLAIETRAYLFAEELIQIVDEEPPRLANGSMDSAFISWQKSRLDARKWILSKLLPKRYGDRLDLVAKEPADNPLARLIQQLQGTSLPIRSNMPEEDEDEDD